MINLLSNSEKRRLQFVEILTVSTKWTTLKELSEELNCSTRVLKDDMAYFRKNFSDFKIHTSNQGIQLTYPLNKGIKNIYQQFLNEAPAFQLLEIIFLYEDKTVAELSDLLSISNTTLYRLIQEINDVISNYGFKISKAPYCITGNEKKIRHFFYMYFYEKYSFTTWPFTSIDEKAFDKFLTFHIQLTHLKDDFAYYSKFKVISGVNFHRLKNSHYVNTKGTKMTFASGMPDLNSHAGLFREFEETFNIEYDEHVIKQLFTDYIDDDFSLNPEHLAKRVAQNKKVAAEVSMLDEVFEGLSRENNIPILNKKRMIVSIRNIIHLDYLEPEPSYILYNRNKHFVNELKEEFPSFYESLYHAAKKLRLFFDKPLTDNGINFYIYRIFTYWKGLVPELRKKFRKIRVTIISDRQVTHARMLKNFIDHEFSDQIVVDIYSERNLNQDVLENLDCELLVTNFLIPKLANKHTVYIANVPIYKDLVNLQNAIDVIIEERLQRKKRARGERID